jgi:hypothetical protein
MAGPIWTALAAGADHGDAPAPQVHLVVPASGVQDGAAEGVEARHLVGGPGG